MNNIIYISSQDTYYLNCPNCSALCQINRTDIKCGIFRHGIYKTNSKFINPHAKKEECDKLLKDNLIYGCGKPFRFDGSNVEKCDYI